MAWAKDVRGGVRSPGPRADESGLQALGVFGREDDREHHFEPAGRGLARRCRSARNRKPGRTGSKGRRAGTWRPSASSRPGAQPRRLLRRSRRTTSCAGHRRRRGTREPGGRSRSQAIARGGATATASGSKASARANPALRNRESPIRLLPLLCPPHCGVQYAPRRRSTAPTVRISSFRSSENDQFMTYV